MKVLVNALPLRRGGGVTYLEQQLAALARVAPDLDLHTLLSPWAEVGDLPGTVERVPVKSVPTRFLYEQLGLQRRDFDVLYCVANFGPLHGRRPMVLTIHNAHYYRSGLQMKETKHLRPWWKVKANHLAMRRADAIVAISNSEAKDALATVRGMEHKLHVIYSATPDWPARSIPPAGLPERYFLSVANSADHKRTADVVAGWAAAVGQSTDPLPLVVVGSTTERQRRRYTALAGEFQPLLHLIGPLLDRAQLRYAYENAAALISMSLLEAFPLTPVEALSVGCPLILSDIPAHREASQGQAVFIPPRDTGQLAAVLANRRCADRSQGTVEPWPLSWDDNARELAAVLRGVIRPFPERCLGTAWEVPRE